MKSKEEIEQLAKEYSDIGKEAGFTRKEYTLENIAYKKGYTQCQEDMADKKYTKEDMRECWNTLMIAHALNKPVFFEDYINSLNKQDNEHI
jgi:hypothetical protein